MLGTLGYRQDHPAIARALDYLWRTQEPEGCWYGRWGVNYIYGTWQVLQGLKAIDFPMDHPALVKACRLARIGPAGRRRLGRDLPELRRSESIKGRGSRPRRRPRGPCSGWSRPVGQAAKRPAVGSITSSRTRKTTGPGSTQLTPARASLGSSTCGITCTRCSSRSWPSPAIRPRRFGHLEHQLRAPWPAGYRQCRGRLRSNLKFKI